MSQAPAEVPCTHNPANATRGCGGTGTIVVRFASRGKYVSQVRRCPRCKGTGKVRA